MQTDVTQVTPAITHTAAMDYEIRPCTDKEFADFIKTLRWAFGMQPNEEETKRMASVLEVDRTLGAFDGKSMVGTAGVYSFVMTVPGAELPTAGVTVVGVLPSHRRRGILSALMRRQLDDIRARAEPVAILWASEGAIYGRYGYGLASQHASLDVERGKIRWRTPLPKSWSARLLSEEEAIEQLPAIYERVRVATPGMFVRNDTWWKNHRLPDPEHDRDGGGPLFRLVMDIEGEPSAYALYRVHSDWGWDGLPHGKVDVLEAIAPTPDATQVLWSYLFDVDLTDRTTAYSNPVDSPLKFMVHDLRRLRMRVMDALWLRIMDVPGALEGRSYAAESRLTFELVDDFCPWNAGTWVLEAGSSGASVSPTDDKANLRLTAEDLGAVYLGGATVAQLQRAGRIEELTDNAVAVADDLFYTDRAPWCPEIF